MIFNFEKLLSALAVVIGRVNNILNAIEIFGNEPHVNSIKSKYSIQVFYLFKILQNIFNLSKNSIPFKSQFSPSFNNISKSKQC